MKNVPEKAKNYLVTKYNCAQSVLMAFAPRFDLSVEQAALLTAGFGSGMCRTGQTCGAVSGAMMVIGLRYGMTGVPDQETKDKIIQISQQLFKEFIERNGSPICHELLGVDITTPEGYAYAKDNGLFAAHCGNFVKDAAEIVEKLI